MLESVYWLRPFVYIPVGHVVAPLWIICERESKELRTAAFSHRYQELRVTFMIKGHQESIRKLQRLHQRRVQEGLN